MQRLQLIKYMRLSEEQDKLCVNNNRDSIRLSMEQHLIEKAGTLQNGINRTCDH